MLQHVWYLLVNARSQQFSREIQFCGRIYDADADAVVRHTMATACYGNSILVYKSRSRSDFSSCFRVPLAASDKLASTSPFAVNSPSYYRCLTILITPYTALQMASCIYRKTMTHLLRYTQKLQDQVRSMLFSTLLDRIHTSFLEALQLYTGCS
jgi:hypothetical protein